MDLLVPKKEGLYCSQGDFFIDPTKRVKRALITHAHTDHAKNGNENYLCTEETKSLIESRIKKGSIETIRYNKEIDINGVRVSFHPAGHILGSAQIRVEYQNSVWVVSGDYKRAYDPTCDSFQPIPCDVFITEATFAKPKFDWKSTDSVISDILKWHGNNKKQNRTSVLIGYKIGKTQRLVAELSKHIQVYYDDELEEIMQIYKKHKVSFGSAEAIKDAQISKLKEALIITSSLKNKHWVETLDIESAFVSGWAQEKRFMGQKEGFALSDHIDWKDLLSTIKETKAKQIKATHGFSEELASYLQRQGLNASVLEKTFSFQTQKQLIEYF